MRKRYAFMAVLAGAGLVVLAGYGISAGDQPRPVPVRDDNFEKLENSIIINGIIEDAGQSQVEADAEEGRIIIDDDFIAGDPVMDKAPGDSTFQKEFRDMMRKDSRWHLTRYRIRTGDNLWSIARRFKIDHKLIIKANGINNPDMLGRGKTILVPNREGVRYRIRRNDTLSAIARRHSVSPGTIRSHNGIVAARIVAGRSIFIPDARPERRTERVNQPVREQQAIAADEERTARLRFRWPLSGRITSSFGMRTSPISGKRSFHTGMDIGCSMETPVRAAAAGKVIFSGWKDVFGNTVIIRHRDGYISVYAHHKTNTVRENDTVKAGDVIARSGTSGASTGPHLHFEIRKHLTPLNPRRFLR